MDTVYTASSPGLEILSCTSNREFQPHLHNGYVLWLNSACGEHFRIKSRAEVLQPGSISIIEPGLIHANHPCRADQRHLRSFYFSEDFLDHISTGIGGYGKRPTLPTCIIPDRSLWRIFVELHESLLHSPTGLQAETEVLTVFSRLLTKDHERLPLANNDRRRVATVIDYFHDDITRQSTLEELARVVHCTCYHLIRLFRAEKGVAPHAYLMQLRLEHARNMLAQGSPISDAALASGFSDQSHLTRLFKARFGVTPGTYRKQRRT